MEFVYGAGGLVVGAAVGVIFSGKIGAAIKSLEASIITRLTSLETNVVAAIKAKI
jgi:large-conductance mechanosensitive channel